MRAEARQYGGEAKTSVEERNGERTRIQGEYKRWDEVRFAHRSEQEFARLLDFYDIKWLYEPVSFDIAWDSQGNPVAKFTPDFYLPEFDLFIEITTMNQKLVTKKNRKIRLLRELYPEVKCKILYKKDFEGLLMKYNIKLDEERAGEGAREDEDEVARDKHQY